MHIFNKNNVKKFFITILISLLVVYYAKNNYIYAQDRIIKKVISIVYDNSGSMANSNQDYAHASYGLQNIIGFMNPQDKLNVVKMSDMNNNIFHIDNYEKRKKELEEVKNYKADGKDTNFKAVETAANYLLDMKNKYGEDSSYEYYLIVMTDGQFDNYPSDLTKYLEDMPKRFGTSKYNGIFIGIGKNVPSKFESDVLKAPNNYYIESGNNTEIINALYTAHDIIYDREVINEKDLKFNGNNSSISFEPKNDMRGIIVFEQNQQVPVVDIKTYNVEANEKLVFTGRKSVEPLIDSYIVHTNNTLGVIPKDTVTINFLDDIDVSKDKLRILVEYVGGGGNGGPSGGGNGEPSGGGNGRPSGGGNGRSSSGENGRPSSGENGRPSSGENGQPSEGRKASNSGGEGLSNDNIDVKKSQDFYHTEIETKNEIKKETKIETEETEEIVEETVESEKEYIDVFPQRCGCSGCSYYIGPSGCGCSSCSLYPIYIGPGGCGCSRCSMSPITVGSYSCNKPYVNDPNSWADPIPKKRPNPINNPRIWLYHIVSLIFSILPMLILLALLHGYFKKPRFDTKEHAFEKYEDKKIVDTGSMIRVNGFSKILPYMPESGRGSDLFIKACKKKDRVIIPKKYLKDDMRIENQKIDLTRDLQLFEDTILTRAIGGKTYKYVYRHHPFLEKNN